MTSDKIYVERRSGWMDWSAKHETIIQETAASNWHWTFFFKAWPQLFPDLNQSFLITLTFLISDYFLTIVFLPWSVFPDCPNFPDKWSFPDHCFLTLRNASLSLKEQSGPEASDHSSGCKPLLVDSWTLHKYHHHHHHCHISALLFSMCHIK